MHSFCASRLVATILEAVLSEKAKRRKSGPRPKGVIDEALVAWVRYSTKGETQADIAKDMGVHRNTVKSWIRKIGKALGLDQEQGREIDRLHGLVDNSFKSLEEHCNPLRASAFFVPQFAALNLKAATLILSATGDVVPQTKVELGAEDDLLEAIKENRIKAEAAFGFAIPGATEEPDAD